MISADIPDLGQYVPGSETRRGRTASALTGTESEPAVLELALAYALQLHTNS